MRLAKILLLICLLLPLGGRLSAAPAVFLSYGQYRLTDGSPYTELYVRIPAFSLAYHPAETGGWHFAASLQLIIRKGEGIIYADKYILNGPVVKDTAAPPTDLIDLNRIQLPLGEYQLSLQVSDAVDTAESSQLESTILVSADTATAAFSSIMPVDTFYPATESSRFMKLGYNLVPSVYDAVSQKKDKFFFYTELYLNKAILAQGDPKIAYNLIDSNGHALPGFQRSRMRPAAAMIGIIDGIPISDLPYGNYQLILRAYAGNGDLICSKELPFSKIENTTARPEDLFQALPINSIYAFAEYLSPIAVPGELDKLDAIKLKGDTEGAKRWFYYFWADRNEQNPLKAYMDYLQLIREVESQFGNKFTKGYKTDMGRIYMKYGKPNQVIPYQDEPEAYPYEIWQYYRCGKQSNVKFVFYNPTRMEKEYELIHSDMRGEISNPQWKKMIYARTNKNTQVDQDGMPADYGNKLNERIKQ